MVTSDDDGSHEPQPTAPPSYGRSGHGSASILPHLIRKGKDDQPAPPAQDQDAEPPAENQAT